MTTVLPFIVKTYLQQHGSGSSVPVGEMLSGLLPQGSGSGGIPSPEMLSVLISKIRPNKPHGEGPRETLNQFGYHLFFS